MARLTDEEKAIVAEQDVYMGMLIGMPAPPTGHVMVVLSYEGDVPVVVPMPESQFRGGGSFGVDLAVEVLDAVRIALTEGIIPVVFIYDDFASVRGMTRSGPVGQA